ncbi:hypothetical protein BGW36DRAFT_388618 [Talaromyces proteolyticus]|uniref:Uncharacterized protein n=1 Tax=Talaromyces proteolyticus TaxID=1131652 RepID=A0AAD4PTZ8_9EURO|nr:uncharacterized protein BGW36DRAFT_388618 [Talaromyces proteolyticus]KAH8691580.1 hypothetical protein BGW36DRAFT_388618 [Talaromyces proteolyticus]
MLLSKLSNLNSIFTFLSLKAYPDIAIQSTCDHGPGYSNANISRFIPFYNDQTNIASFTDAPMLSISIDGKVYDTPMDTGSTGLQISAADMVDYDPESASKYPVGWQFFTSSKKLNIGNWISKNVSFLGANMTASIPVLAVNSSVICPWYNVSTGTNYCPTSANGTTATPTNMPSGTRYMGVGFGREYNAQPQGTPEKISLINIDSIDGERLKNDCITHRNGKEDILCLNQGYIISKKGVTVGLTPENTEGFAFVKLSLNHSYTNDPRDWTQTAGCISVNGAACETSSLLLDTGVSQAYLTIPPSVPVKLISKPSKTNPSGKVSTLADGQNLTVYFGSEGSYAAMYNLVVGEDGNDMAPTQVSVTQSDTKSPYYNSGRHFYRDFDVLYDAIGGYLGLRWTGNVSMNSHGSTCLFD